MKNQIAPFFPALPKNRLLFDAIGEFGEILQLASGRHLYRLLFNRSSMVASIGFQTHLIDFNQSIYPLKLSRDELIQKFTLYPYYYPFTTKDKHTLISQKLLTGHGESVNGFLGLRASIAMEKSHLSICPECVLDQSKIYGNPFWVSWLQLPGVYTCPVHKVRLLKTGLQTYRRKTRYKYISLNRYIEDHPDSDFQIYDFPDSCFDKVLNIAKDSKWLLENSFNLINQEVDIKNKYLVALHQKGYANLNGKIQMTRVVNDFNSFWLDENLSFFIANSFSKEFWQQRVFYRPYSTHPLLHLLIINFLGLTTKEFFKLQPDANSKTTTETARCLNKICPNFNKFTAKQKECSQNWNKKKYKRLFLCKCGYSYYQFTKPSSSQKKTVIRVQDYGRLWFRFLENNWLNDAISLRELSDRLGCDPKTIMKQAKKLNLASPRPNSAVKFTQIKRDAKQEKQIDQIAFYREKWMALLDKQPNMSITELRKIDGATYTWLYRHDCKWLNTNSPQKQSPHQPTPNLELWFWFDLAISIEACVQALNLNAKNESPKITKTHLAFLLSEKNSVYKTGDKFWYLHKVFANLCESRVDFAIRRIWSQINNFNGQDAKRWHLVRRMGLGRIKDHPMIQHELDLALAFLFSAKPKKTTHPFQHFKSVEKLCSVYQDCKLEAF